MKAVELTFWEALSLLAVILFTLSVGCVCLHLNSQIVLLVCTILAALFSGYKGWSSHQIEEMVIRGVQNAAVVLVIDVCIGMLIGMWIASGTFSFFLLTFLRLVDPRFFLVETFLFCCIFSAITGSSWICAGTVGLALFYISQDMQICCPLLLGAIAGGARFGACISPISESASVSALLAGVDSIYDHIQNTAKVMLPGALSAGLVYFLFDLSAKERQSTADSLHLIQSLNGMFRHNILTLMPVLVLCVMIFRKRSTIVCLLASIGTGAATAILLQKRSLWEISDILFYGYGNYITSNSETLQGFFTRGGIASMFNVLATLIVGMALSGILTQIGALQIVVEKISARVKGPRFLVLLSMLFSILGYGATGDSQPSKVLISSAFSNMYKKEGLKPSVLSRTLEMAPFGEGIFPWTVGGVYLYSLFGVSVSEYWYFVFFYYFSMLFNLLFLKPNIYGK